MSQGRCKSLSQGRCKSLFVCLCPVVATSPGLRPPAKQWPLENTLQIPHLPLPYTVQSTPPYTTSDPAGRPLYPDATIHCTQGLLGQRKGYGSHLGLE